MRQPVGRGQTPLALAPPPAAGSSGCAYLLTPACGRCSVCRVPPTAWSTASFSSSRRTARWCPPGTTSPSSPVRARPGCRPLPLPPPANPCPASGARSAHKLPKSSLSRTVTVLLLPFCCRQRHLQLRVRDPQGDLRQDGGCHREHPPLAVLLCPLPPVLVPLCLPACCVRACVVPVSRHPAVPALLHACVPAWLIGPTSDRGGGGGGPPHTPHIRTRPAPPSSRTSRRAPCASTPTTSTGTTACCPRWVLRACAGCSLCLCCMPHLQHIISAQ
jgi:hypothetical protein